MTFCLWIYNSETPLGGAPSHKIQVTDRRVPKGWDHFRGVASQENLSPQERVWVRNRSQNLFRRALEEYLL